MSKGKNKRRCFEDLATGETFDLGACPIRESEILAFAREFDPQPFHLDRSAAEQSLLGGLAASGWYTAAILMRLFWDGWLRGVDGVGSPGLDGLEWLRPVRAGDRLQASGAVIGLRESRSRPGIGLAQIRFEMTDSKDRAVCRSVWWIMIQRRNPRVDPQTPSVRQTDESPVPSAEAASQPDVRMLFLDSCPLGETFCLGGVRILAEEIVRFAKSFDPQPFHVDEEKARKSHFGGLIASGWHTCALWMRANVLARKRVVNALPDWERDSAVQSAGVGIGFEDLTWVRPVRAGEALHAFITPLEKRESRSRPGWGRVRWRAEMTNENEHLVLRFFPTMYLKNRTLPV